MGPEDYIGSVSAFAGTFAPRDWVFCNGQLLALIEYQALFSLISTYYGGDGRTNFGVPDLRGRSILGVGSGSGLTPRSLGQKSGQETVSLLTDQIPSHNHAAETTVSGEMAGKLKCVTENGTSSNPNGGYIASHSNAFLRSGTVGEMNPGSISLDAGELLASTTVGNTGNGQAHTNMHPWQAINYVMCVNGLYPSRS